ncbi:MAG: hypothetical protein EAZ92_06905 [Candidatus Kapaibacterium sp.]|nr:MAG: hypothetical protein EAZ92_06905 [Candidatus Kapabacteria bacterium]
MIGDMKKFASMTVQRVFIIKIRCIAPFYAVCLFGGLLLLPHLCHAHDSLSTVQQNTSQILSQLQKSEHLHVILLRNTLIAVTCTALALVAFFALRIQMRQTSNRALKQQNKALAQANKEIERQQRILEDQAAEIELANSELSESNLHLQRLNDAIQAQLQELETLDEIVKNINREQDVGSLLQVLLQQGHRLLPQAEKGSVLALHHDSDDYRFVAFHHYSVAEFKNVALTHEEMERRYTRIYGLKGGVYIVSEFPSHTPEGQKFKIQPPACALLITIPIDGVMEGILFFDNFSSKTAFTASDIERCQHYREHAIAAFAKVRTIAAMQKTQQELAARNNMLQALNMEKNEFLGIAAHDMKNPLAQMTLSAGMIKRFADRLTPEELYTKADHIEMTAMRMSRIISKLLDINAIETGTMQLQLSGIELAHAVAVVVRDLRPIAERKGIMLIEEYEKNTESLHILADPFALRSIIENIGSNAVKYSPPNTNVHFRLVRNGSFLRLAVADRGQGISKDDMTKLFGKFARLSSKPTAGENSTGLGLSIVKTLTEMLHGKVWCESDIGKGTTFFTEFSIYNERKHSTSSTHTFSMVSHN